LKELFKEGLHETNRGKEVSNAASVFRAQILHRPEQELKRGGYNFPISEVCLVGFNEQNAGSGNH
jgi:hypothetical protein